MNQADAVYVAKKIIEEWPQVAHAVRDVLNEQDLDELLNRAATRRDLPAYLRSVPGVVDAPR